MKQTILHIVHTLLLLPAVLSFDNTSELANVCATIGNSFYENGKCYTVHIGASLPLIFTDVVAQCTDIEENVQNSGLVMWLPNTVQLWLDGIVGFNMGLIGIRSHADSTLSPEEWADSQKFTQSIHMDGGPTWPAKLHTLFDVFKPTQSSTYPSTTWIDVCMYYGDWGHGSGLWWNNCQSPGYDPYRNAYICVYENNKDVRITRSLVGRRMKRPYVASETIERSDTVVDCAYQLIRVCAPCHSFSYNKATGQCQLYIPDSRVGGYDAMLEGDDQFDIWQYV